MKDVVILGDRDPGSPTHRELDAALALFPAGTRGRWVGTDTPDASRVVDADALWLAPGTPYRDDAAAYAAITAARVSGQPFFGTCGGFQYAVVEFARNVAGIAGAEHAETAQASTELVVTRLSCSLVGEARNVTAVPGTRMHQLCGGAPFAGFHWCNYGLAPGFVDRLTTHGLRVTAMADDAGVEAIELPAHPFFLATLFQPQVGALAGQVLHPVIQGFLRSVWAR